MEKNSKREKKDCTEGKSFPFKKPYPTYDKYRLQAHGYKKKSFQRPCRHKDSENLFPPSSLPIIGEDMDTSLCSTPKIRFPVLFLIFGFFPLLPLNAESRPVRVGVFPAAPLVLIADDKPGGLFIDLIAHFSRTLNWRIEYVHGAWSDLLVSLKKGDIDLLPAVGFTQERTSIYDFSKNPIYIDSGVLFTSKKFTLHTVFDLQGKRVAAVEESIFTKAFIDYLDSFGVKCDIKLTRDNREVMRMIADGETEAGVCIYSLGNELAKEFPVVITPISFSPIALEFAVPKGRNADLIAGIDRLMVEMIGDPDSFYSVTFNKWTAQDASAELPAWFWWGALWLLGFVVLLIAWNISLKRQVMAKTRNLVAEIAERKQAEEEVRRLNTDLESRVAERTTQLQEANKELESFAYSVAHDLRAPLRTIDGFSEILIDDYSSKFDAEGNRVLNIVRTSAKKMDQLITGILALSHAGRTAIQRTEVDMNSLAQAVYDEIASTDVKESFTFSVADLPTCIGDQTLLRQVWINLIGNAIKFSPTQRERRIEISGHPENGMIVYSVKDSGVGFDQKYADKLFGVFQRLHPVEEFEGTGIGLSIVARIIKRHGGKVRAEGEVGKGATFHFELPQKEPSDRGNDTVFESPRK